jgi:hypothetical protein
VNWNGQFKFHRGFTNARPSFRLRNGGGDMQASANFYYPFRPSLAIGRSGMMTLIVGYCSINSMATAKIRSD